MQKLIIAIEQNKQKEENTRKGIRKSKDNETHSFTHSEFTYNMEWDNIIITVYVTCIPTLCVRECVYVFVKRKNHLA